jgi:ubiquinone biosynthesis protein Coq4
MEQDDMGNRILAEKPRIREPWVNRENLLSLPANTFGHVYG